MARNCTWTDHFASNDAWVKGNQEWISHLKKAYRKEEKKLDQSEEKEGPNDENLSICPEHRDDKNALDAVSEQGLDSGSNRTRINSTDIDASFASKGKGKDAYSRARYKNHRSVDDENGVITASITTTGCVGENTCFFDLLKQSQINTGILANNVSADSQYGTQHILARCQREGIQAFIKAVERSRTGTRIGRDQFNYDREQHCYICPMGHALEYYSNDWNNHRYKYRCSRSICSSCALA